jgi:4-hydroxybenzoate polyprenyltransferase
MSANPRPPFLVRWWIYQRERFPLAGHGPLIAAFSFCAVSYSRMLRTGGTTLPPWPALVVAFITCLIFFLQLRIADEFKDFDEDAKFRPYRPVPRGLVTLRELGVLFVLVALVQLGAGLLLAPRMGLLLLAPWIYLAAMSKEFWAREWLMARPIHYMWTHMLIMPLVDFYATGCDWLASGAAPPRGLGWFLAASLCNGVVFEIGRKLRAPADEETGVRTFTVMWGIPVATSAWLGALTATGICAWQAARAIGCGWLVAGILGAILLLAVVRVAAFRRSPIAGKGKAFERIAAVWTLALYLSLGALPYFLR